MRPAIALVLTLQIVLPLLMLGYGAAAVRVAQRLGRRSRPAALGWAIAGSAFLANGASNLAQGVGAAWAYVSGPGTPVYDVFIRWFPLGNQSRTGTMIGLALALLWLARLGTRARPRRFLWGSAGLVAGGMLCGGMVALLEGEYSTERHWTAKAVMDAVSLIALLAALTATLLRGPLDRLLWLSLTVYTVHQAWNVISFSAMAWFRTPGAWAPNPIYIQAYAAVAFVGMIALAQRRLQLARRGVDVPGLLDAPVAAPLSTLG